MKNNILNVTVVVALACPVMVQALSADISIDAGLAYDSNAYRTPADSYVDYFADPTGATTQPTNVQSGFFVPLALQSSVRQKLNDSLKLMAEYNYDTRLYLDSALENAEETDQLLKLGAQYTLFYTTQRSSHVYVGYRMPVHKQTYYDRDTGSKRIVGAAQDEIADAYSYSANGFELSYDYQDQNGWQFDVSYKSENRDYDKPVTGSEYDYTYARFDASAGYKISTNWDITYDFALYSRDYDLRHARDLNGVLNSTTQPLLTYGYTDYGLTLQQQISKNLKLKYAYSGSQREDEYVGYNDYDMNEFMLGGRYRFSDKLALNAEVAFWQQDYPNAWNFDRDPTQIPLTDHKTADGTRIEGNLKYKYSTMQDWWLNMEMRTNNNSDPRYDYDRMIVMAGSSWKF